jgi:multidrug efflux pump subunit AcrB
VHLHCVLPVLLLTGAAKYLFTPMALAVVFSILASYGLSRTLVPVMARYLLLEDEHGDGRSAMARCILWSRPTSGVCAAGT